MTEISPRRVLLPPLTRTGPVCARDVPVWGALLTLLARVEIRLP